MKTIDLHVDYPWQCYKNHSALSLDGSTLLQVDFPRMEKGGLDQFIAALYLSDRTQDTIGPERSWNAIMNQASVAIHPSGKVRIALEGGRLFNEDEEKLKKLRSIGCQYITLTHNFNTNWADSATDKTKHNGLTATGKTWVKKIQQLGMFVDVSHASDQTTLDVLKQTLAPVIATHSGCLSLVDHPRNLSDFLIKEIAATGGLIGVVFASKFVEDEAGVVLAIDHIAQLTGNCNHIAIGSDFDGAATVVKDVSEWSNVLAPLLDLGYTESDLAAIKGGNWHRLTEGKS